MLSVCRTAELGLGEVSHNLVSSQSFHQVANSWRCHQMEIFSALLAICEGNPPVTKASDGEL